jgi:AcrR family transcriptional regulator
VAYDDDAMMNRDAAPPPDPGEAARRRIIDAAIQCVIHRGVAEASMAAIATTGGVSKALLHYHFSDRARLLTRAVTQLADRLIAREAAALQGIEGRRAVDALWQWVQGELVRGELRALVELGTLRNAQVRLATEMAMRQRRQQAAETTGRLFAHLGLTPRVPLELLGEAHVVFLDGLSSDGSSSDSARASFDVFWLALLGLAE